MAMQKRARREEEEEGGSNFSKLPPECVLHVLSFTTPRDSCRSAVVSTVFLSCMRSDALWGRFLPSDYAEILSRAVHPVEYSSNKELYFSLCKPILVDDGKLSFQLEISTGGKCFMVSSKSMWMEWRYEPLHWRWIPHSESRFGEVAELVSVCWLHILGNINSRLLSQETSYKAYIVFKLTSDAYGLNAPPQKVELTLGAYSSNRLITLQPDSDEDEDEDEDEEVKSKLRDDGWMEIELGEFYNDERHEGEVEINLKQTDALHFKHGLLIEGLEFRPRI